MLIDSIFTGRPESRPLLLTLSLSPLFLSFLFLSPSFPSGSKVEKGNIRTRIIYIVFLPYRDSKKKREKSKIVYRFASLSLTPISETTVDGR